MTARASWTLRCGWRTTTLAWRRSGPRVGQWDCHLWLPTFSCFVWSKIFSENPLVWSVNWKTVTVQTVVGTRWGTQRQYPQQKQHFMFYVCCFSLLLVFVLFFKSKFCHWIIGEICHLVITNIADPILWPMLLSMRNPQTRMCGFTATSGRSVCTWMFS